MLPYLKKSRSPNPNILDQVVGRAGSKRAAGSSSPNTLILIVNQLQTLDNHLLQGWCRHTSHWCRHNVPRSKIDTRELSQGIDLPVWDSVSTHLMGRSTHSGISVT
ncbi:hypothetical protein Taro_019598 [Colocasia esculenta]|uniref:Uncharacterized protein n=1 Tax=Colocasia esculenta TaxID=4460 RepID=A0A843V2P0_COLES|nr:hypothetical protein [Colocasia esculenta]